MKKFIGLLGVLILTLGMALPVFAENDPAQTPEKKVELTAEQQKELAEIHEAILAKKFELIDKHVEFGAITQEDADKIKEKIQKKAEKMKENGYMMRPCKKCHD